MNYVKKQPYVLGGESPLFTGKIGNVVLPVNFHTSNYIINSTKYDYEGNWAFCSFTHNLIYSARFGFGCGKFVTSDYGQSFSWEPKSIMVTHIELMTANGAVLWICNDKFTPEQIKMEKDRMGIYLFDMEDYIFRIEVWPNMRWYFMSNDREISVDMCIDLKHVIILPDNLLQHNLYAMWVAVGEIRGTIRIEDNNYNVDGVVFYDHPRIIIRSHDVLPLGWYLYTPTYFNDGSFLIAHYTCDYNGNRINSYSFGLYIDKYGNGSWLEQTSLNNLIFDNDNKPKTWQQKYEAPDVKIKSKSIVKNTSIKKIWGSNSVPKTRKDNTLMPLVFNTEAVIKKENKKILLNGKGLAEILKNV